MTIFSVYQTVFSIFYAIKDRLTWQHVSISALAGLGVWAIFFILLGAGLFTMAKNRGMKNKWLAFVPFANTYYMGKLAGETSVFGQKMKRAGLYAMISEILFFCFLLAVTIVEAILFVEYGSYIQPSVDETTGMALGMDWINLPASAQALRVFYLISDYISGTLSIIFYAFMFLLMMTLYKKYSPKNYMVLSLLEIFIPVSKSIAVFVLRNRTAIDFDEYMRARREAYMRQQQQRYGQYPPYGNPYANPYGNPYANPYGQSAQQPQSQTPPEDPFSEFGGSSPQSGSQSGSAAQGDKKKDSDDLFD